MNRSGECHSRVTSSPGLLSVPSSRARPIEVAILAGAVALAKELADRGIARPWAVRCNAIALEEYADAAAHGETLTSLTMISDD